VPRLRDWRDDVSLYTAALAVEPGAEEIRNNLAVEYVRQNRVTEAMAGFQAVIARNPANVTALENIAYLQSRDRNWEGVRQTCARVLELRPASATCRLHLAMADHETGNSEAALTPLEMAIHANYRLWQAYFFRGNIHAQQNRFDDAILDYESAIAARPTALAYTNLGNALVKQGRTEAARAAYESALRLDPNFRPARDNLRNLTSVQH
jgi:tetratricopeptide (TPR) repeat protein